MLISRPGSNRHSILFMMDVFKSSIFHILFKFWARRRISPEIFSGLQQSSDPFLDTVFILKGSILRIIFKIKILKLRPFTRRSSLKSLAHQLRPIYNSSGQVTDMDIIKLFPECPRFFGIINLEFDVRRYPSTVNFVEPWTANNQVYQVGCVALRSVPIIWELGNSSAISMAHMPVPVPMSSMFFGFSPIGARKSLSPSVMRNIWCVKSRRSSSLCANR